MQNFGRHGEKDGACKISGATVKRMAHAKVCITALGWRLAVFPQNVGRSGFASPLLNKGRIFTRPPSPRFRPRAFRGIVRLSPFSYGIPHRETWHGRLYRVPLRPACTEGIAAHFPAARKIFWLFGRPCDLTPCGGNSH